MGMELVVGIIIVAALAGGLLVPYLMKEIGRGKAELVPNTPPGDRGHTPGRTQQSGSGSA